MAIKRLLLDRFLCRDQETVGALYFNDSKYYSIERPWIPAAPGGLPFESCIPAGLYQLIPHTRANGDKVLALVNPGLAVYYLDDDRPSKVGRYLILMHSANFASEVAGCIAPGAQREETRAGNMVVNSKNAMRAVMHFVGKGPAEIQIIGNNNYQISDERERL